MNKILKFCSLISVGLALATTPAVAKTTIHKSQEYTLTVNQSSTNITVGAATAVTTFNNIAGANVANGDTLTLSTPDGGARVTYMFTNAITSNGQPYSVLIGADAATSSVNLLQAINNGPAGAHAGTNFGSNTPISLLVSAAQTATNILTLTALTTYPGNVGNKIGISAQSLSNVIQFTPQQATLVGGYDYVVDLPAGQTFGTGGVGFSCWYANTNSGSVTNLTSVVLGAANSKPALRTVNPTNVTPSFTIAPTQAAGGANWYTNLAASLIGNASSIGVIETINTSASNNVPLKFQFSWTEDDGK